MTVVLTIPNHIGSLVMNCFHAYRPLFHATSVQQGVSVQTGIMLKLFSFHNDNYWENILKPLRTMSCIYKLWHWHTSLLAFHPCCGHWWSKCHCLHAGHCFTRFFKPSQLTTMHVTICACTLLVFSVMLKCFCFTIIPKMNSIIDSSRKFYVTFKHFRQIRISCTLKCSQTKNKKEFRDMTCHTPLLKKEKNKGKCHYPA